MNKTRALKTIGGWLSANTNRVTEFGRQLMYAAILFQLIDWSTEQQIAALAAVSAFLAMFTEGGTVSRIRMTQRMDEKEAQIEQKVAARVEATVAHITGHDRT